MKIDQSNIRAGLLFDKQYLPTVRMSINDNYEAHKIDAILGINNMSIPIINPFIKVREIYDQKSKTLN